MDQQFNEGLAALSSWEGRCGRPSVGKLRYRVSRVLIEPLERGWVALWLQISGNACLKVESGTPEWEGLWREAGIEPPCDTDVGADLGEAVRQLRGKVIGLQAVAA
jgi:hypothetical protein